MGRAEQHKRKRGEKSNTRGHKINKLETELQGNCHSTVIEKKTEKRQNQEHVKDLVIDLVDDYRKRDLGDKKNRTFVFKYLLGISRGR